MFLNKKTYIGLFIALIFAGLAMYSNCGGANTGTTGSGLNKQTPFISLWETTTPNETITLPLRQGFQYNMTVVWGDGTSSQITAWNDTDKTHTYAQAGQYTVTMKGIAEAWYFNNSGDKDKILSISDLGDMGWKNFEKAFYGCSNLTTVKGGITSKVTNTSYMFHSAGNAAPDLEDWDTSNVTNMSHMFNATGTSLINPEVWNLSGWDTSKVTNMSYMFSNIYNEIDIGGWNTSNVTNMSHMFLASDINPDVSHFKTSKVTDMTQMFYLSSVNPDMATWNFAKIESMNTMLMGSQLSNVNYTALLKRIHQTRTVNGVTLNATSQYYTSAATARASLIADNAWVISDNGSGGIDPM